MKILIPLAGRGSRFIEAGYTQPKPLIPVIKEPMIKWALKNVQAGPQNLVFFVLQKHIEQFQLDQELKKIFSDQIMIIPITRVTEGAPVTLLQAKEIINTDEELLILNGDQFFPDDLNHMISTLSEEHKGLIPVFRSTQTKFSYAKADLEMNVLETAEKIPISNYATAGAYYFKHGKDFVWAAEQMIDKDIRRGNEFFVCPVYNELIQRGDKIKAVLIEKYWTLGTPEDVDHFKKYYRE